MSWPSIMGFIILFFLLIGIFVAIDWYKVFNKKWGNNPERAKVYVEFGENVQAVDGKLYGVLENTMQYRFKWAGQIHSILVKHDYPWRFIKGRRQLRYIPGKAWAQPLPGYEYALDGGSAELDAAIEGQTTIKMVWSIHGRKAISLIAVVLVIAAVCVGGYMFYQNMTKEDIPPSGNITIEEPNRNPEIIVP